MQIMETDKDVKPGRKRNLIMVEVGDDLRKRVALMASKNQMSVSAATRLLIQKALMSSKDDRLITIAIPEDALIPV